MRACRCSRSSRVDLLGEIATGLNYADLESLYGAIGENHVSAKSVAARVTRRLREVDPDKEEDEVLPTTARQRRKRPAAGVHVEGLDDLMVRLSRCCTPVPGDDIIGFVTRGRGVTVHRADCANAVSLATGQVDRLIDVEWDDEHQGVFVAADRGQGARPRPPPARRGVGHVRPPRQHPHLGLTDGV